MDEDNDGMFSSRSFAIGLVGIASCYLIVMICKAYKRMNEEEDSYIDESITYYYDTESYDFNQYESADEQNPTRGIYRNFEYNQTIGSNSNIDENESADMRVVINNINKGQAIASQNENYNHRNK